MRLLCTPRINFYFSLPWPVEFVKRNLAPGRYRTEGPAAVSDLFARFGAAIPVGHLGR